MDQGARKDFDMSRLGHRMILASAGSGKTYTLVNRYLRLLALGVEPGRIIALTFTRKAAGEFLQKIFLRLGEAARDEKAAATLCRELELESQPVTFFRNLLAALVREIGSLQLGTIDSFFARVVGAFPYELGLTRPHRIMDTFEQNMARQLAMERLMAVGDEERAVQLLQLYKEFTWGAEEKNVYRLFEDSLNDCHALFLEARKQALWGGGDRIYNSPPWWMGKDPEIESLIEEIRGDLCDLNASAANIGKFGTLLDRFSTWKPGQPFNGGTLFERLLEAHGDLAAGHAEISCNRAKIAIDSPMAERLLELLKMFMRQEIARRLLITQSLGKLLREFDRFYEASVRETGSLVFADLPMLLVKGLQDHAAFSAEDIVYRLDGQTDHWLIDEFQDTSRIQWKVLSAFVDEVLQDPSGRRTFFYVGDIKQSIYSWRGGDSRLFEEIFDQYQNGANGIRQSALDVSWRSAPPVLDCVNDLFGQAVRPPLVDPGVAARWSAHWKAHSPSSKTAKLAGHAAWGLIEGEATLGDGCVDLIRNIDPLGKGLSCAILVRRNRDVLEMTQALREAGIPASMEGVVHIAMDNIVGTWMRALFLSLARPDEAFPAEFTAVAGFPFPVESLRRFCGRIRTAITEDGYAEAVRLVLSLIRDQLPLSPFLRRRSEQLLEAATHFEGSGMESLEGFLHYLEIATVEESTLTSQIQVMTVHKAKGLDFDMVVVAGFGPETLLKAGRKGLHVERRNDGEVDWILDLPNKLVTGNDRRLAEAKAGEDARNVFEALCLLYVAMTRARQGLYCLAEPPGQNSSQTTWHMLFEAAFSGGEKRFQDRIEWQAEWGDPAWHADARQTAEEAPVSVRLEPLQKSSSRATPSLKRAPSPSTESHQAAVFVPVLRSTEGRRFGTLVHDFLATIEWVDPDDGSTIAEIILAAPAEIRERLAAFFQTPGAREVFARPGRPCRAWREKPYILRKGDQVANGIIDRATVFLDEKGNPERVRIYDFKTDALDPGRPAQEQLLERYGIQLERYREAVEILTGLPPDAITATLIPV